MARFVLIDAVSYNIWGIDRKNYYMTRLNEPFDVTDPKDIAFFKNHPQFDEFGEKGEVKAEEEKPASFSTFTPDKIQENPEEVKEEAEKPKRRRSRKKSKKSE